MEKILGKKKNNENTMTFKLCHPISFSLSLSKWLDKCLQSRIVSVLEVGLALFMVSLLY